MLSESDKSLKKENISREKESLCSKLLLKLNYGYCKYVSSTPTSEHYLRKYLKFLNLEKQCEIYLKATKNDVSTVDGETKVAILLLFSGPDVVKVFDQIDFDSANDKKDVKKVLEKLEHYCMPLKNEVLASHKFWSLEYYEPFDKFLTDLRVLAEECSFWTLTNRLIRDKLVFVTKGRVQARLLRKVDLSLDHAIAICRADETAERCSKESEKKKNVDKVKVKSTKSPSHYSKPPNKQGSSTSMSVPMLKYDCKFCGRKHLATKESCPAYGQECRNCRQENHFSKFYSKKRSKVQTLNRREDDYDD